MKLFVAIIENNNLNNLLNKLLEANIEFKNISFRNPETLPNSTILIEGESEKEIIEILQNSMSTEGEYYFISEPPFEFSNGIGNTFILNLSKVYQLI